MPAPNGTIPDDEDVDYSDIEAKYVRRFWPNLINKLKLKLKFAETVRVLLP